MNSPTGEWRDWLIGCRFDEASWLGSAFLPSWRAVLGVRVEVQDGLEPSGNQLATLAELVHRDDGLRAEVGDRLLAYYKDAAEGVATAYDPATGAWGPDPDAPPIAEVADLWQLVADPEVWVDDRPWQTGTGFVFAFACLWDREHGVGVRVVNWQVVDVGGAAEV